MGKEEAKRGHIPCMHFDPTCWKFQWQGEIKKKGGGEHILNPKGEEKKKSKALNAFSFLKENEEAIAELAVLTIWAVWF